MTPAADIPRQPLIAISPSQSLEDIHYNLAQEISRAMSTATSAVSPPSVSTPIRQTVRTRPQPPTPRLNLSLTKSTPIRSQSQPRAPIMKPSPAEEELVRRIHRKVGGPSKLSTYDDPAKVRHVVIEALALEQTNPTDASRIRKGQLSVFERRVVRTVTNRGAAVRSRMRQRKEVAQLKYELRARDMRVRQLESFVRALCAKYSESLPDAFLTRPIPMQEKATLQDVETEPETDSINSTQRFARPAPQQQQVSPAIQAPQDMTLDHDLFGNLMDQMITSTDQIITQSPWA